MDNNEGLDINDLNNVEQHDIQLNEPSLSENLEQITFDELQYEYLKELNKKMTLFKKNDESGKREEETEKPMRR